MPVSANAAPGTTISLAGIGLVMLNARTNYPAVAELLPLTVRLSPNSVLGLPAANVVVARSYAFLTGPETSPIALRKARAFIAAQVVEYDRRPEEPAPGRPHLGGDGLGHARA